MISREKAACNPVGPRISCQDALAYAAGREILSERSPKEREAAGDGLFEVARQSALSKGATRDKLPPSVQPCFTAILQGDHGGVEFATSAHEGLLVSGGLLHEPTRILNHHPFPSGSELQGLVIDDYFVITQEPAERLREIETEGPRANTLCRERLEQALEVYKKHGVIGSPEKDVANALLFTVAGAQVDSTRRALRQGLVTAASPAEKRCALSWATLSAAALPVTSRGLLERLVGSWVHCMMYRRPTVSCFSKIYKVIHSEEAQAFDQDEIFRLPRAAADELVVASILSPLMASNLAAKLQPRLFASDASLAKGAIVSTPLSESEAELLWRTAERKGGYSKLDPAPRAILRGLGDPELEEDVLAGLSPGPSRNPLLQFDFVEICSGSSRISHFCVQAGLAVCPPLDLELSRQYDLLSADVILWIVEMLREGRLLSAFVSPPCTTFSPAAHPALRTYQDPWGDHSHPKVRVRNILAQRALAVIFTARTYGRGAGGEQPRRSKMAWLRIWRSLAELPGVEEFFLSACQFRLIGVNVDFSNCARPCRGGHEHVRVEGRFTKDSAIYPEALAREIAISFCNFVAEARSAARAEAPPCSGLESPIINDLLAGRQWSVDAVWRWKRKEHINLLETRGLITLLKRQSAAAPDTRLLHLFDSSVALEPVLRVAPPATA